MGNFLIRAQLFDIRLFRCPGHDVLADDRGNDTIKFASTNDSRRLSRAVGFVREEPIAIYRLCQGVQLPHAVRSM